MRLAAVAAASRALPSRAQDAPRDTQVKAAYLLKFFTFVEWPDSAFPRPDSPVNIGVLGDEQLLRDLRELARPIEGRPVVVTRLNPNESVAGLQIVYGRFASASRAADYMSAVPEGVLTVADSDGIHPRGSVLSFFIQDGKVRFAASVQSAAKQRLRLSSRLLSVARSVQGRLDPWPGGPWLA